VLPDSDHWDFESPPEPEPVEDDHWFDERRELRERRRESSRRSRRVHCLTRAMRTSASGTPRRDEHGHWQPPTMDEVFRYNRRLEQMRAALPRPSARRGLAPRVPRRRSHAPHRPRARRAAKRGASRAPPADDPPPPAGFRRDLGLVSSPCDELHGRPLRARHMCKLITPNTSNKHGPPVGVGRAKTAGKGGGHGLAA
jgi:hypothetical protein